MKKKVSPNQTDRMWFASDPNVQKALHHFLSPIEWAAYENKFKAFDYDMDGVILRIDGNTNLSMLSEAKRRALFFFNILKRMRIKLAFNDPKKLAFLHSRPEAHGFSNNLLRKLSLNGIRRMDQLASIGKKEISGYYRLGKTSAEQITVLFEKHDCGDLF